MTELVSSGQIVLIMLLFVALEVAVLLIYWYRTGKGIDPLSLILNVGAGSCLMGGLLFALMFAHWDAVTVMLLLSLVFHVADLWRRWTAPSRSP
jgi:hypothetical protein